MLKVTKSMNNLVTFLFLPGFLVLASTRFFMVCRILMVVFEGLVFLVENVHLVSVLFKELLHGR